MVEVEGFEGVVGADAVAGGFGGEFGAEGGFFESETAREVGGDDEFVVGLTGNGDEVGHDVEG